MESIQILSAQLQQLERLCQQPNPEAAGLQRQFLTSQQQFQGQVLPLAEDPAIATAIQPIVTEMNRTFRLLAMDVAFLQAARQPVTAQQRQRQMIDKLEQLMGFTAALTQVLDLE